MSTVGSNNNHTVKTPFCFTGYTFYSSIHLFIPNPELTYFGQLESMHDFLMVGSGPLLLACSMKIEKSMKPTFYEDFFAVLLLGQ